MTYHDQTAEAFFAPVTVTVTVTLWLVHLNAQRIRDPLNIQLSRAPLHAECTLPMESHTHIHARMHRICIHTHTHIYIYIYIDMCTIDRQTDTQHTHTPRKYTSRPCELAFCSIRPSLCATHKDPIYALSKNLWEDILFQALYTHIYTYTHTQTDTLACELTLLIGHRPITRCAKRPRSG